MKKIMLPEGESKGGSWKQSGGLFQPPWLFRRKAIPPGGCHVGGMQSPAPSPLFAVLFPLRFRPEAVTSKGCNLLHAPLVRGIAPAAIPQRMQPDICGCSSSGRAPPCQGGGSEFEPRQPLQKQKTCPLDRFFAFGNGSEARKGIKPNSPVGCLVARVIRPTAPVGRSRTKSVLDGRILC